MSNHSNSNTRVGPHGSALEHAGVSPEGLFTAHQNSVSFGSSGGLHGLDMSADPYAGQIADNGKEIWSAQHAADNLNRAGVNFTFGNNGALDDGVLTYGFWDNLDQVLNGYYGEINSEGYVLTADSVALYNGYFAPFTDEQREMAANNVGLWDDLIAVTFKQVDDPNQADITFGFTQMSLASGAHTYYPQEEALNYYYDFQEAGKAAGDVWANIAYQGDFSGVNSQAGNYGWFAITHELGHSLGLSHGGDYNASDDNDGDGQPDPITYQSDAYFFQDSNQYTIMSYFDGSVTGQAAVNWDTGYFAYAQTPAVHDILAVQEVYGADYTTRSGNTVYGFNSTADRDIFDFTHNKAPILTIWDGGGKDTLDLSGFKTDSIIDINEGAFSSAGYGMSDDYLAYFASLGIDTQAELDAFYARNGLGPDGRPVDNIAIAYGAKIENAIGGSGNDEIHGNALDNMLSGNAGDDILYGGAGKDELIGGDGADTFVFGDLSVDKIRDFHSGQDHIDLSAFNIDSQAVKIAGSNLFADTDGNGSYDFHLVVQGQTVHMGDIFFA